MNKLSNPKLSGASIRALENLVGQNIYLIYSSALEVEGKFIRSDDFSLSCLNKYLLNLETIGIETDENAFGSWQLTADYSRNSKYLKVIIELVMVEKDEIAVEVFERPPSTIYLTSSASVERIGIYEDVRFFPATDEFILYGEALMFHCRNGKSFCIAAVCYGHIEPLIFTEDQLEIISIQSKYQLRQEIT